MKANCFSRTPVATLVIMAIFSTPVIAADKKSQVINNFQVMTVTAPTSSPLTIISSPKTPRQPVPASDGSDYLKTIPGFSQIRNGGTNGDPVFRGMFGSRLRILTNNSEMLGACPSRMDAPSSYISPESFDLLTLTKGPQTVLWGPGNSAGTVRFEQERPYFEHADIKGTASALAASNDRWDVNADISMGNQLGYLRLTGNKSHANDYKDGDGHPVPSKWSKWNTDIALGWTPDEYTLLELTAGKGDGEARYAGRGMDGSQFKRDSLGLRIEKSNIGEVFDKFEANIYYNYADHVMDNYSLRSPSQMMGGYSGGHSTGHITGHMPMVSAKHSGHSMSMKMPMAMELDRKTVGGRMMGSWIWSDFELQSGADMQINTHRSKRNNQWNKDARFQDYGIFSELTWKATEQSSLISGARVDRVLVNKYASMNSAERTDTLPAGFIRFEHTLAEKPIMLYAGIGYTERFPDYWELFSPTYGPGGTHNVFNAVKSEKTRQLDIGAQYSGKQINGWISAYIGQVDNFILFRYDAHNARISQVDNINATIMGGEMGMSYQITDTWKTDASVAYAWGENTSDHHALPQMPPLETRLTLGWQKDKWSSTGLLRLVSRQGRIAINQGNVVGKDFDSSAGYAVFSANAAYQLNDYIKLSSGVDNLFDKTYSEHLNLAGNSGFGYSSEQPINEPGRTFWAKLNVTF